MTYFVKRHGEIISQETRALISKRYRAITKAVNLEFWNIQSELQHSIYVGSYGRGTAIETSDLDVLVSLPKEEYQHYDTMKGNGQSRLLQSVRQAILYTYPRTDIRADGQVVKVSFSDGMKFEILPAFETKYWDGRTTYRYPDTNMGGNWLSTNPKAEQDAMKVKNEISCGLLIDTCKHIRYIRDNYFSSYHLSGIVIDSFVYQAISGWKWVQPGESSSGVLGEYEKHLLRKFYDIFSPLYCSHISAPGSDQMLDASNSIQCLEKILCLMAEV